MRFPQPGIFAQGTRSHYHLEFDVRPDAAPEEVLARLELLREPPVTMGGANLVIGFGSELWRRLAPDAAPDSLAPFRPIEGAAGRRAPATQHDVWVWIHGTGHDVLFDFSRAVTKVLAPVARLAHEQPAFIYHDSRDLFGFIDGTENPPVWEAHDVALVPQDEIGGGGTHALLMQWQHDLDRFERESVDEQERVIGRTKQDSEELPDDVMPATSHVSRNVVEEDGEELEIYRRSVPWGTLAAHGLIFLGFSAEKRRFDLMLDRMYGLAGDGLHDRVTDYSRAITGAYYFVPSLEDLHRLFG